MLSLLILKNIQLHIYRTIDLSGVCDGCESRSLTSRGHKLGVFKEVVLRKTTERKKVEITEVWKKEYNEKLSDLYSSLNITRVIKSRRITWAGHVAHMGGKLFRGLVRQLKERDHLEDVEVVRGKYYWVLNVQDGSGRCSFGSG